MRTRLTCYGAPLADGSVETIALGDSQNKVFSCSIEDPYVLVVMADGSLRLLTAVEAGPGGGVDSVEVSTPVLDQGGASGSLFTSVCSSMLIFKWLLRILMLFFLYRGSFLVSQTRMIPSLCRAWPCPRA